MKNLFLTWAILLLTVTNVNAQKTNAFPGVWKTINIKRPVEFSLDFYNPLFKIITQERVKILARCLKEKTLPEYISDDSSVFVGRQPFSSGGYLFENTGKEYGMITLFYIFTIEGENDFTEHELDLIKETMYYWGSAELSAISYVTGIDFILTELYPVPNENGTVFLIKGGFKLNYKAKQIIGFK